MAVGLLGWDMVLTAPKIFKKLKTFLLLKPWTW
jgi:hypothetical protein